MPLNDADGFGDARRAHRAQGEGKKFGEGLFRSSGFYPPQPFDFPRNRQRNLWKSLEKRARDLEMFGKKLGGWRWTRGNQLSRAERPDADRGQGHKLWGQKIGDAV